jgi:glycosyltransferase involved in cell wall biosynthesis
LHKSSLIETPLPHNTRALSSQGNKKILFVLPNNDEYGGLEKHLLQLIETLIGKDVQISIICFGPDIFTAHLDPDWVPRLTVWPKVEPKTLSGWTKLFWDLRPDIVVFCYGWIASFPWQATIAVTLLGIRRRFAIQHLVLPPLPPPIVGRSPVNRLRRLMGRSARILLGWRVSGYFCSRTICVSNAVRDTLVNTLRFPPRKTITVHNGVSISTFVPSKTNGTALRARLGVDPEEFLLICAARLTQVKGIDILLQAVSRVVHQGIPCKCIIVGDGPLKEILLQQAQSLDLTGRVFFEGFQKDVRPYLQAGSAFILTSRVEGLPLSVLEAMACGLPCIVTNVGGSAEAVIDQVIGLVIPPDSVDAAAEAIRYLATHSAERDRMASGARETVCKAFDIEDRMRELRDLILS